MLDSSKSGSPCIEIVGPTLKNLFPPSVSQSMKANQCMSCSSCEGAKVELMHVRVIYNVLLASGCRESRNK